ncbi:MAG: NAD(P)/FAD-dependent oxidoreductase [Opitutaceae bacterium]
MKTHPPAGPRYTVIVIGGGAAGFFAAITCAEVNPRARVLILEKTRHLLSKVRISGGGRCNVTHACFDPQELVQHYPRGSRELLGPFHLWQPRDTIDWFAQRGVPLKTESDGRMFPITDSSSTIIDCLLNRTRELGIEIREQAEVQSVVRSESGSFRLSLKDSGNPLDCNAVIVASGGGVQSGGLKIARDFGHTITELAPSLFTFHVDDPRIKDLQGLAALNTRVSCRQIGLQQTGPVLITHWGLSGPAILRLSAWGARAFAQLGYCFEIEINWTGPYSAEDVRTRLNELKSGSGKRRVSAHCPFELPRRLWERLLDAAEIGPDFQWARLSKAQIHTLATELASGRFQVTGKSLNKEEFVTCGGVELAEIDFKRMESKRVPGLFFAGEVLDIDGVTGGFNFQAAWTTGHIAGTSAGL